MRITRYHTDPPNQAEGNQVITMVEDNVTDLSLFAVPPSNLLYEFYRWALPTEIGGYMTRIGMTASQPVELLLAFDSAASNEVVGFRRVKNAQQSKSCNLLCGDKVSDKRSGPGGRNSQPGRSCRMRNNSAFFPLYWPLC
jgi:hypothetical protein